MNKPAVYTLEEVCELLQLTNRTARRLAASGKGVFAHAFKVGSEWRVPCEDVDARVYVRTKYAAI